MNGFTQVELDFCRKVVKKLMNHPLSSAFLAPVDTSAVPDYAQIVKEPMDLGTVNEKLNSERYGVSNEFVHDIDLIWDNAIRYNKKNGGVLEKVAIEMKKITDKWLKPKVPKTELDLWMRKVGSVNAKIETLLKKPVIEGIQVPRLPEYEIK